MAPSTCGTLLRAFTFGHVRQLDRVFDVTLARAWALGAGPEEAPTTVDLDSTITEIYGKAKQGAAYDYSKVLGQHPLLATRADPGEILHVRHRKGSAATQRGAQRLAEELIARLDPLRGGAMPESPRLFRGRVDRAIWSKSSCLTTCRTRSRTRRAPSARPPQPGIGGSRL